MEIVKKETRKSALSENITIYFSHNGELFFADMFNHIEFGVECAIFHCINDEDMTVQYGEELLIATGIEFSEESLLSEINSFCSDL